MDIIKKSMETLEFNIIREKLEEICSHPKSRYLAIHSKLCGTFAENEDLINKVKQGESFLNNNPYVPYGSLNYMEETLKKLKTKGYFNQQDFMEIRSIIVSSLVFIKKFKADPNVINHLEPYFKYLFSVLFDLSDLLELINKVITEDGAIPDNASPNLKELRSKLKSLEKEEGKIVERIHKKFKGESFFNNTLVTRRNDAYCISIPKDFQGKIKGVIQDVSGSGRSVFVEPYESFEVRSKIKVIKNEEQIEIRRILDDLSLKTNYYQDEIISNYEILGDYNFLISKVLFNKKMGLIIPEINDESNLELLNGGHPLLEGPVICNDVFLNREEQCLIITGPNTGGKTVLIKMIGLFSLMVRLGLGVKAKEGSKFPFFSQVFVEIGDNQNIHSNLSTFSAQILNLKEIMEKADHQSLLIFDELGNGTDPDEGAPLAMAVTKTLINKGGKILLTTHFGRLKEFNKVCNNVVNGSLVFDNDLLQPTYKFIKGLPGASLGLVVAKKYGIKDEVIDLAKSFVKKENLKINELLEEIEKKQSILIKREEELGILLEKAEEEKDNYEQLKVDLEESKKEILRKLREEKKETIKSYEVTLEKIIKEYKKEKKENKKESHSNTNNYELENDARLKLNKFKERYDNLSDKNIKSQGNLLNYTIGEVVMITKYQKTGVIEALDMKKGKAVVRSGLMKMALTPKDFRKLLEEDKPKEVLKRYMEKPKGEKNTIVNNGKMELDVRGKRYEEAMDLVEVFLDQSLLNAFPFVTIIHGRGTYVLKKGIWELLKHLKYVKSYRKGDNHEGGDGVTIVYFQ